VIATPVACSITFSRRTTSLSQVQIVVLDEAIECSTLCHKLVYLLLNVIGVRDAAWRSHDFDPATQGRGCGSISTPP